MRIDEDVKREILARADIAEVIGTYVTLRKRGNALLGLCPFHAEKTPSFNVHPDRGFFKCFGCGEGGDVVAFLRKHENLTFPEAMRVLAARVGVELEAENPAQARVRSEREAIYHANAVAQAYWHRVLVVDEAGAPGREYVARRGLSAETVAAFGLGYAPESWDGLAKALRAERVDAQIAVTAGLLKIGTGAPYDVYRDRLIFPTRATTGELVAFGGRALANDNPAKYINTAATPVHTKGRFLFALDVARRSAGRDDALIVVEGYLDAIALHEAGITNAVAALGTAFTVEQAKAVHRVASRAYLCYDADDAGRKATLTSLDLLHAEGVTPWIVRIPQGKDPDEFVRAHGADAFRALLTEAIPATQFRLDAEIDARGGARGDRTATARWAEETLRRLSEREEWDRWRVYVAGRLELSPDDLRTSRLLFSVTPATPSGSRVNVSRHVLPGAVPGPSWEREVLAALVSEPMLLREYESTLGAAAFSTPPLRALAERLFAAAGSLVQPSDVLALLSDDDEAAATLASVAGAVPYADTDQRRAKLDAVVARFRRGELERRYKELGALIDRLWTAGEAVPDDVRDEHRQLAAQLKG